MTNIDEARALAIAQQHLRDDHAIEQDLEDYEIELETGGMGHTLFGLNERCWLITFTFSSDSGFLPNFESEYMAVYVDAENGEVTWIP